MAGWGGLSGHGRRLWGWRQLDDVEQSSWLCKQGQWAGLPGQGRPRTDTLGQQLCIAVLFDGSENEHWNPRLGELSPGEPLTTCSWFAARFFPLLGLVGLQITLFKSGLREAPVHSGLYFLDCNGWLENAENHRRTTVDFFSSSWKAV